MSVDEVVYVVVKARKPDDAITPRHPEFCKAIRPSAAQMREVKELLEDHGITVFPQTEGDKLLNRVAVQSSERHLKGVFGADLFDAAKRKAGIPVLSIRDETLKEMVSDVMIGVKSEAVVRKQSEVTRAQSYVKPDARSNRATSSRSKA